MKGSPEKIAIVGQGYLPLMCAAYMAKQFAPLNLQITVVQVGKNVDPPAISSLGSFGDFLHDLGVSPKDFLRETGAECNLAYCYKGWRGDGEEFRLCNAEYGFLVKGIRFHQLFERYRELGEDAALDDFCLAAVTAKLGRVGFASPDARSIYSTLRPGYRMAISRVYAYLERLATSLGVNVAAGELQHVHLENEQTVEQLTLADGRTISADLFLDLTEERLVSGAQKRAAQSVVEGLPPIVSHWHSSSAAKSAPSGEVDLLAGADDIRKIFHVDGIEHCQVISTKSNSTGNQAAYTGSEQYVKFDASPWVGNCIALGAALTGMPGILVENGHFVQSAMNRLYVLWPSRTGLATVATVFNRETSQEIQRAGEIEALHLRVINGDFAWSETLNHRVELFQELGKLPFLEREILQDFHWVGLFYALGYSPKVIDPQAYAVSDEFVTKELDKMRSLFRRAASELPMYGDFMRHIQC